MIYDKLFSKYISDIFFIELKNEAMNDEMVLKYFYSKNSYSVYVISSIRVINVWSFPERAKSKAKTFSTKLKKILGNVLSFNLYMFGKFLDFSIHNMTQNLENLTSRQNSKILSSTKN